MSVWVCGCMLRCCCVQCVVSVEQAPFSLPFPSLPPETNMAHMHSPSMAMIPRPGVAMVFCRCGKEGEGRGTMCASVNRNFKGSLRIPRRCTSMISNRHGCTLRGGNEREAGSELVLQRREIQDRMTLSLSSHAKQTRINNSGVHSRRS